MRIAIVDGTGTAGRYTVEALERAANDVVVVAPVGDHPVDRGQDRLLDRSAAAVGTASRA